MHTRCKCHAEISPQSPYLHRFNGNFQVYFPMSVRHVLDIWMKFKFLCALLLSVPSGNSICFVRSLFCCCCSFHYCWYLWMRNGHTHTGLLTQVTCAYVKYICYYYLAYDYKWNDWTTTTNTHTYKRLATDRQTDNQMILSKYFHYSIIFKFGHLHKMRWQRAWQVHKQQNHVFLHAF